MAAFIQLCRVILIPHAKWALLWARGSILVLLIINLMEVEASFKSRSKILTLSGSTAAHQPIVRAVWLA